MRLPFFPVPAEGETVFSVVGRCSERLGITNRDLMTILAGQRSVKTLFSSLPGYLAKIASAMPSGHPWQDVYVPIHNHTALPYFTYFHPSDKRRLSPEMLATAESSQPIITGMGLTMYRAPAFTKSPRFCRKCISEQLASHGFSYFHVAHQLPGVSVCWKHDEALYDGCTHCGPYPLPGKKLTMPGECLCTAFEAKPASSRSVKDGDKWLAHTSAYLLTTQPSIDDPIEKLRKGVLRSGLGKGSLVDYALIAEAIESRLGQEFLSSINYPVTENGTPSAWLRRYLSHGKAGRQLPTIAGLLISAAAFESIQDFVSNNPIVRSTGQRTQATGNTTPSEQWKTNLQNILSNHAFRISSCAAALNRTPWEIAVTARDQSIRVPLSPPTIKRIGRKRLAQIIQKLENGDQKKQILTDHQISEWTLLLIELSDPSLRKAQQQKASDKILQSHRKVVINLLGEHPNTTRTDIMEQFPGTYDFLIRRDKAWFQATIPRVRRKRDISRSPRRDWESIDKQLSVSITESAAQAISSDAKPERITATALLSHHGEHRRYTAQPDKFPETRKALEEVVETTDQYLVRKISWGIKQLTHAEQTISIENLRRICGIPAYKLTPHLDAIRSQIYRLGAQVSEKSKLAE